MNATTQAPFLRRAGGGGLALALHRVSGTGIGEDPQPNVMGLDDSQHGVLLPAPANALSGRRRAHGGAG